MAAIDSLPADQRAVLSLVLTRGRSYDEIADMLAIDRAGVRDRALAALDALGPATDLSAPQRALITDYLLGQLPARVADETHDRLASSRGERAWAAAVAVALEPIAGKFLPEIPHNASAPPPWAPAPAREPGDARAATAKRAPSSAHPAGRRPSSRRGGAILLGAVGAIVLIAIVVLIVGGLGSGTSSGSKKSGGRSSAAASSTTTRSATPGTLKILGHAILLPPTTDAAHHAAGIAEIVRDGSKTGIVIAAQGLQPNTSRNAYAVWLVNSAGENAFLGFVSHLVTANGKLTADGALPADTSGYTKILLTLETEQKPAAPGPVVLEGGFTLPR